MVWVWCEYGVCRVSVWCGYGVGMVWVWCGYGLGYGGGIIVGMVCVPLWEYRGYDLGMLWI